MGQRIIVILSLIMLLWAPQPSMANWLNDSIVSSDMPSSASLNHGAWVWGGSQSIKVPSTSIKPFHIALPKITAGGCGGINAFWGGFSMLDPDMLVQFGQNVLAAAPSYAFELALQGLCEPCQAIMGHLNKIAGDMNSATLDSCNAAKGAVKLMSSYMPTESVKGVINSSAKEYLSETEKAISSYADKVHSMMNTQISDFEATPVEKRLVVPDDANHYLSLWVSVVAHKVGSADFNTFDGHETIRDFFVNPKQFIEYMRAITGDLLFARGVSGVEGTSDHGQMSGWTASDKYQFKIIADKFLELYPDKTKEVSTLSDCGGVNVPLHPAQSVTWFNRLHGLKLPNEPDAAYTAHAPGSQGYSGFAAVRVGSEPMNIPDQELSCFNLLPPEPGCVDPVTCLTARVNDILNNIRATNMVGVRTTLDKFAAFNELPLYLFTNRVGLLSVKFPGVLNEVRTSLSTIAAYSYGTARLNAALSVATKLIMEIRTAAEHLKKKDFEDYKIIEDWTIQALQKIDNAKAENTNYMTQMVKDEMIAVGERIKYYMDIENGITRTVSASSFNALYASGWR